ncbi:MAG TPA: DUF4280 domain-containing protein [Kofleriaceae bacterium]|nr:DUF4280 domain-containing protein [Kofleriaceae bacterium]
MMCSFGVAPSSLVVLPVQRVISKVPMANATDFAPVLNVPPFGACTSLANPTVAAATSAALGVLTPMPCVPVTGAPWVPGSMKVMNGPMPAVDNTCKQTCMWGGVIQVLTPGQTTVIVG